MRLFKSMGSGDRSRHSECFPFSDGAELTVGGAQRMADDDCERIAVSLEEEKKCTISSCLQSVVHLCYANETEWLTVRHEEDVMTIAEGEIDETDRA